MEQSEEVIDVKSIVKRRKWWLILPCLSIIMISTVIAFVLPNIYMSSAVILIQNQQIPSQLVTSTVTSYVDQRIQTITQEINSRSKILHLVEKFDLLPEKRNKMTTEALVEKIQDRISIEPINADIKNKEASNRPVQLTIAFRLSFQDKSPKKAQLVTTEIASYYMEKNLESREKHAHGTTNFLENQRLKVKKEMDVLEEKLARYRQVHLDELPEFTNLNMQKMDKINTDINNVNMQIRSLEEQHSTVRNRLLLLDPHSGASNKILSPEERLQQTQLELAELVSKYSDKHPIVQAKSREYALLQESVKDVGKLTQIREGLRALKLQLADQQSRYSDKHPLVKQTIREIESLKSRLEALQAKNGKQNMYTPDSATNPAYVAMKADMEKIEIQIDALRTERWRMKKQSKALYGKLHAMPQVAKEYNSLEAEYQMAKAHYDNIQQKLMAAQVSEGMENEQLGESFQIVEPAFLPEEHYKPNRLAIMLISIIMGFGVSIGLAFLKEYTDRTVHDSKILERHTGMPVLSMIPRIITEQEEAENKKRNIVIAAGVICGGLVALLAFHFLVMDLYVFYTKVIRFFQTELFF